jgi:hypothetical protein
MSDNMTEDYTGPQLAQLINLVNQKKPTKNEMRALLESGILSELLEIPTNKPLNPQKMRWHLLQGLLHPNRPLAPRSSFSQCARTVKYSDKLFCDLSRLASMHRVLDVPNLTTIIESDPNTKDEIMTIRTFSFDRPHFLQEVVSWASSLRPGRIEDLVTWGSDGLAPGSITLVRNNGTTTICIPFLKDGNVIFVPATHIFDTGLSWVFVKKHEQGDLY